jgi:transcriptional regulator with XRE-family HTH domain
MLNTDEIRRALHDRQVSTVADHTGVNRNTILNIKKGTHTNPTAKTIKLLSDYLAPVHPSVGGNKAPIVQVVENKDGEAK